MTPANRPRCLFVGSSSIERWKTLNEDFPEAEIDVLGVGARQLQDIAAHAAEEIVPRRPDKVFLYAGSIDLGKRPASEVRDDFIRLCETVHARLPETIVHYLSCKPSLSKWDRIESDRALNRLVREYAERTPRVEYIDTWTPMIGPDGMPPAEYFVKDRNHLSPAGYRVWIDAVRPYVSGAPQ